MPPNTDFRFSKISLFLICIAFGCASKYRPVSVAGLSYRESITVSDTLKVGYRYNVQEITSNRWYAKKEKRYKMAAIAVRIENVTNVPITINRENFKVYSAQGEKSIITPQEYASKVKQRVAPHLLHCLWGPWGISWSTDAKGETDVHGYYIPVGALVGIGNAVRASNANASNKATLEGYEIWNKVIEPGKTVYGLIAIPAEGEEMLTFSYGKTPPPVLPTLPAKPTMTSAGPIVKNNFGKSYEYNFYVVPQTGKSFSVYTKIYATGARHFIVVRDSSKAATLIYPPDTKTLSRMTPDGKQLLGIPNGDRWMFKILSGKINAYSALAEPNNKIISDLQKEDGPIVPFSSQALIEMVAGDAEAIAMIRREKYTEAISIYNKRK